MISVRGFETMYSASSMRKLIRRESSKIGRALFSISLAFPKCKAQPGGLCSGKGFWGTVGIIGGGIGEAFVGLKDALGDEELQRGVLFGFIAGGRVTAKLIEYTAKDVLSASASAVAGKVLPGYKDLNEAAKFAVERGLAWRAIPVDVVEYGKEAREMSRDIEFIRDWVW
jgi:hypothetical protein